MDGVAQMTVSPVGKTTSVEHYDALDADEWNQAVSVLGGSFYHLYQWRRVNECTLKHRSVYLAERLAAAFRADWRVLVRHRALAREGAV